MKLRLSILAALCVGLFTAAPPALADNLAGTDTNAAHSYLALGDSLAEGFQPNGDLTHGYADQLYAALKADDPTMQLENLACGGETTSSMISGVEPTGSLGSRYFCAPLGPGGTSSRTGRNWPIRSPSSAGTPNSSRSSRSTSAVTTSGCASTNSTRPASPMPSRRLSRTCV
jgi:hypothetical protein